jgi:hypothetical protein
MVSASMGLIDRLIVVDMNWGNELENIMIRLPTLLNTK